MNFENGIALCPKLIITDKKTFCNNDNNSKNSNLSILYANLGGNLKRLNMESEPIFKLIKEHNPDILSFNETMAHKISKVPSIPGYLKVCTQANLTAGRPSGGVVVYYKTE